MPWKETCAMDQLIQFIRDWLSGDYMKTELCEAYGISRPTGDKWIHAGGRQQGRPVRIFDAGIRHDSVHALSGRKFALVSPGGNQLHLFWHLPQHQTQCFKPSDARVHADAQKTVGVVRMERTEIRGNFPGTFSEQGYANAVSCTAVRTAAFCLPGITAYPGITTEMP